MRFIFYFMNILFSESSVFHQKKIFYKKSQFSFEKDISGLNQNFTISMPYYGNKFIKQIYDPQTTVCMKENLY
jgi:hypothetical protein